jgi:hypothetical protein
MQSLFVDHIAMVYGEVVHFQKIQFQQLIKELI